MKKTADQKLKVFNNIIGLDIHRLLISHYEKVEVTECSKNYITFNFKNAINNEEKIKYYFDGDTCTGYAVIYEHDAKAENDSDKEETL